MSEFEKTIEYNNICFHCGNKSVYWQGDFSFQDYGMQGEGIIHKCHCSNCGADITYEIPTKN